METGSDDGGPLDDEELSRIVGDAIDDAANFIDTELSAERARALRYYRGEKFGDEKDGRSQVITTEVRDTVHAILPSIMRVFHGSENVVEYVPDRPQDVASAKEATEYVRRMVMQLDNPGFMVMHAWFHDALVQKLGFVKSYWEELDSAPLTETAIIRSPEELQLLQDDPKVASVEGVEMREDGSVEVTVQLSAKRGKIRIECVPPEEMLFSRSTRSLDTTPFVAHRRDLTKSELLAMGISEEVINEAGKGAGPLDDSAERVARNPYDVTRDETALDESQERYEYVEAYLRVDRDGDGLAELNKVCALGSARKIVDREVVDEQPFSTVTPFPTPHTIIGQSVADTVMDLQWIKSHLMRAMNDSLALAIFPRVAYVEGRVSVADLLNDEIGAPVRMDAPGMVQPMTTPFVGKEALTVLEYLDRIKEQRVGLLPATIDSSALQSAAPGAVDAAVSASQQQVEMICRVFAEGVKHLFRRVLKLCVKHQPYARMMPVAGQYVPVNPGSWNADMHVNVNVALGMGMVEQKLALIGSIKQSQEQILQLLGPGNPLVSLAQYSNTLLDGVRLAGRQDAERYFSAVDPNWQPPQPDPAAAAPDPNMELVKIEGERMKLDAERKQQELQLKVQELQLKLQDQTASLQLQQQKMQLEHDRETDKNYAEQALRAQELEMKYAQLLEASELKAHIDLQRLAADEEGKREKRQMDAEVQLHAHELKAESAAAATAAKVTPSE